jgi:hypothetical protein
LKELIQIEAENRVQFDWVEGEGGGGDRRRREYAST